MHAFDLRSYLRKPNVGADILTDEDDVAVSSQDQREGIKTGESFQINLCLSLHLGNLESWKKGKYFFICIIIRKLYH